VLLVVVVVGAAVVLLVVVVVGAAVVLLVVVVVGAAVVLLVVVVVVGLQHSYASISFQLPTLGLKRWRIKLPAITRPVPSKRTYAFNLLLVAIDYYLLNIYKN
jgi:hypothetical protein